MITKTKTFLFVIFLSLRAFASIAQIAATDVESRLTHYFKHLENEEYEPMMDYIYPKLFEIVPKQQLLTVFKKMKADSTMKMGFSNFKIKSIGNKFKEGNVEYSIVNYEFSLVIELMGMDQPGSPEKFEFMYESFKEKFGEDNVLKDEGKGLITCKINTKALAIKDLKYSPEWMFFEWKDEQEELLKRLVSESVYKKVKNSGK